MTEETYEWYTTEDHSIKTAEYNSVLMINNKDGEMIVSISYVDGEHTFGPNYNPTEAVEIFWDALSHEYKEFLRWKKENLSA